MRVSKGKHSLWRDARAAPLDGLMKDGEKIIRWMICDLNDRAVGSGVQRVKPSLGDPRGQRPSGKFRMPSVDGIRCEVACHFAKLA